MHVTVIGATGMLGTDLMTCCSERAIRTTGLDLPDIDITNPASISAAIPPCDWVINCAAYTNVDGAESDADTCFAINATGAANLARYCASQDTRLLHVSTDYVFDGSGTEPYSENDATNPLSAYGASKLAGEQAVLTADCRPLIARTQSLFGIHGANFIKAILRFIDEGKVPLKVVDDQVSCPTWSMHLADALLNLTQCEQTGIVHTASNGSCSWFDFARAIVAEKAPGTEVLPVPASTYPRPAARPPYSVLSTARYTQWTGRHFPNWEEGLRGYLDACEKN